ncbi:MAG TPA: ferredoxin [Patescibacteria group bacterium]|nr:ferredoxin [Patescibacteria group bacterium]
MLKVNKEKCIGCGLCVTQCDGGTELKEDGKATVIDSQKLEECGGKKICPYGAIEKMED